jgi:D-glycero-alpha-D-manno-heptose-7-phosphate kinase
MLYISRTPYRVSLFGGGSDYPEYYKKNPGCVIGFAINKYLYMTSFKLKNFQNYNYRFAYSQVETICKINQIKHPAIKAILKKYKFTIPIDVQICSEIPSKSGLGSSSAFSVGFINLIKKINNEDIGKKQLAFEANLLEHKILREKVGIQDQLHCSYGNFNKFDFYKKKISVTKIILKKKVLEKLMDSFILVYTGVRRNSSFASSAQVNLIKNNKITNQTKKLVQIAETAYEKLLNTSEHKVIDDVASLLYETWNVKKKLTNKITNHELNEIYDSCIENGAIAGKLLGAGAGGFFLMMVPKSEQKKFFNKIDFFSTKIELDKNGSQAFKLNEK